MGILAAVPVLSALGVVSLAYIDPTTGGVLIQILLGGTAGVLVLGKIFWHRLKRIIFFRQRPGPQPDPEPEEASHTSETPS